MRKVASRLGIILAVLALACGGRTGLDQPVSTSPVGPTCASGDLGRGCLSGPCLVTGPEAALPVGATVTVAATPVPAALNVDAVGEVMCEITVSGAASVPDLTLTIGYPSPPTSGILFEYAQSGVSSRVLTSQASAGNVAGLVSVPGTFGITALPEPLALDGTLGESVVASGNPTLLLLNLSEQVMTGAFFDGVHLFVCNGPRLLIYNALPEGPAALPDVVLGQPDLDTFASGNSSSLFGSNECRDPWSDGQHLAVANGSRILIWNSIPTTSQTPADLELGQPDFSSDTPNIGGVSASVIGLEAVGVASDGAHFAVADRFNNRILYWNSFPTTVGQAADFVIGQATFATASPNVGAIPFYQPMGAEFSSGSLFLSGYFSPGVVAVALPLAHDNPDSSFLLLPTETASGPNANAAVTIGAEIASLPGGGIAVRDSVRVVAVTGSPSAGAKASYVLGEPDPQRVVSSPTTASVTATLPPPLSNYTEEHLGRGKMVSVPDYSRLLLYETPPSYNFEPASRVLGQAGFTTNGQTDYRGISASTLAGPSDLSVSGGMLAVADRGNNRVLLYATGTETQDAPAAVVLGQPDMVSYVPNVDQTDPGATTLSGPEAVALDGAHLIVADSENHRVLIWNQVPRTNGAAADIVLGQATFSDRRPNHGAGDMDGDGFSDADAVGMFYPSGVASDGTHLFVSDRLNNRILTWSTFPTVNGQPADGVIGQTEFSAVRSNGGLGDFAIVPTGLNLPMGIGLSGTSLYVADSENNRVVRWDSATTTPTPGAFLGQPDGETLTNPNYVPSGEAWAGLTISLSPYPASENSTLHPRSVTVSGDMLFVSEVDSNRVHIFDANTLAPAGELGQQSDTGSDANGGGVGSATLSAPWGVASDGMTLWVADSANNRVLAFASQEPPTTGMPADAVLGQPSFLTAGFNQASTAAGGATSQPHGLALFAGKLYVADTENHRVRYFQLPIAAGQAPVSVLGQPNGTLALPNSGGQANASTLSSPHGVYADSLHIIVADTGNNRVLVYDAASASSGAELVLGQGDFGQDDVPSVPTAASMNGPTGVYSDGVTLWVADTANNRVLGWMTFPTSNAQPADVVLGQSSFGAGLSNQGGSNASAATLSFPGDVLELAGVLFVADSGNNRILYFSTLPQASSQAADGVLGQPDFGGRLAAVTSTDLAHLAGPVKVATDGANLYVADRDLARVVVYGPGPLATGEAATQFIATSGALTLASPGGVAAEATPLFTSLLYVADTGSSRVDVVGPVSRLAAK